MNPTITLEDIYTPIQSPIKAVPETILQILSTSNELAEDVVRYFFSGKGKLLRPALTLLGAGLKGAELGEKTDPRIIRMAASYEIFHAATLIHDDIIDSAYLRRNLPTVNTKWDAQTAVLVGDYLHDKAIATLFQDGSREIFALFLETAGTVCDGEIHELKEKNNWSLNENDYLEIIHKKTAVLLACCLEAGARFAGASEEEAKALNRFGNFFGAAFQIIDDCLDFTGNEHEFGKTLGADCEAGVLTLPLIRLLSQVPAKERSEILHLFKDGSGPERFRSLLGQIRESGALDYAFEQAKKFSQKARAELAGFPDSASKQSLDKLLDYVLERQK